MKIYRPKMHLREYVHRKDLPLPLDVMGKISEHHVFPMSIIRNEAGFPIYVSANSGYRPVKHELEMGRDGLSTHTFKKRKNRSDPGWGAADYQVHTLNWKDFIELMVDESPYNRLILYPMARTPFVHGDYRFIGLRKFYYVARGSELIEVTKEVLIETVINEIVNGYE